MKKRGKTTLKNCKHCEKEFEALNTKIKEGKEIFCSNNCYKEFRFKNKKDVKYLNKIHQKKNKYNLNEKEYLLLMEITNCSICNTEFKNNSEKCIDHCHFTKKVRNILCNHCNTGLGQFKDNITYLKNAILYLEKYRNY